MLIVTANCKNTFDSYLKYVHYTDSKRRRTRFSGATGWLIVACAVAVTVSFVKIGGNIFLYVVSAVLLICAAAYLYIQYLAPYRAFKKLDKSFLAEQEFDMGPCRANKHLRSLRSDFPQGAAANRCPLHGGEVL